MRVVVDDGERRVGRHEPGNGARQQDRRDAQQDHPEGRQDGRREPPPQRAAPQQPPQHERRDPCDQERYCPLPAQERERVEHVRDGCEQGIQRRTHEIHVGGRRAAHRVHQARQGRESREEDQRDEREGDRVATQQIHSYNLGYESAGRYLCHRS